ncbi:SusC/RagA family protein [Pedobacter yulinensis]|uniref:SusC/RagA family protein n=1 Tax=Pedobacter yulinensis TaxID=2126353 RepID=A0A2T3HK00_9SPHI|nr:TonB-dependent receptor [Pedobacter yulinensis]PST82733.1 SusC/RagA family protein [Pedobacter yulinensis]
MNKTLYTVLACILFFFAASGPLFAQTRTVRGHVTDENGAGLPGVVVAVKGENTRSSTDPDGNFSIGISGNQVLVFTYVGMQTREIGVSATQTSLNVSMKADNQNLDDVVVVGYGAVKKSDLTGSVATLKGSELNRTPAASVDQLLQGKIAGVQVITSGGQPGSGATIRIRGASSLNGSKDPLMVVDGLPFGDAGNLKQINPEDIESIEVLKDASSAAIYGSRAANGVILVTTKKGKAGQSRITFSSLNTLSALSNKPDLWRDPVDEAIYANEAAINGGAIAADIPYIGINRPFGEGSRTIYYPSIAELRGLAPGKGPWPYDTDWVDLVYRNPFSQSYTLGADGGSEKTKYALSGNYYSEDGIAINNGFDKYTGRLNLSQQLNKVITVGTNVVLAYTNNTGFGLGVGRSRIFPAYDENGNYFRMSSTDYGNPLSLANRVLSRSKSFDLFGTLYADARITSWLQFRSQLSSKYGNSINDQYDPRDVTFRGFENKGFGSIDNGNYTDLLNENYFTATKNFGDDHQFNLVVGNTIQKTVNRSSTLIGREFVNDNLLNENLETAVTKSLSNGLSRFDLNSYYGRLNYVLFNKYLFTATARADGSTKFGANNKWAFFPSGAIAWKLNEENFIKSMKVFSELKLRASYGLTGNQGISPYQTLDRFGSYRYFTGAAFQTGFGPGLAGANDEQGRTVVGGLGNNSLRWETTRSFDAGIDIGLMDQRFTVTADFYIKKTDDLLRLKTIAPSAGYDQQWINDGEVKNTGFELGFNAEVLRGSALSWTLGGTFTLNRNEVISMGESNRVEVGTLYEAVRQRISTYTLGQPMYAFYGYRSAGIIQTVEEGVAAGLTGSEALPGEIKYLDISGPQGVPDGIVDANDRTMIGNPNPDFLYSINTNLRYKGFDLSAQLYGVQGNEVWDFNKMTPSRQILRWTPDNPSNDFPRANANRGYKASDFFLTDGSFLRIQNITLGYNFKPGMIKGLNSLRAFLSANNLYTFTRFNPGYDPEVGELGINTGGYPRPRAFSLGINVGF